MNVLHSDEAKLANLDDLLRAALAQQDERKRKRANPYVEDMISVLLPYGPEGVQRQTVLDLVRALRIAKGLRIPATFDEAVQSTFNHHYPQSLVFIGRKTPIADGLFFCPRGKGIGIWAVNSIRAATWRLNKFKRPERS